jgi:thioredoxin reductase
MARSSATDVAIIGAGPYGLSLAAHLGAHEVEYRVFGEPMGSWKNNMPSGMLLKSFPWATSLSDPASALSVKSFCSERALPYHDEMMPLSLNRFIEYGEAFQARYVPRVERRRLVSLEPGPAGFCATFADGGTVHTRRVVLAVGLPAFKVIPREANNLAGELFSHSSEYGSLAPLDGKDVVVVGSGSSASDLVALLHERGTRVSLVARRPQLYFAARPRSRRLLERVAAPMSGIGHGWTLGVCANYPELIHLLSQNLRVRLARSNALGPLGGVFVKERVIGQVPLWLGRSIRCIEAVNGKVKLHLADNSGKRESLQADHVVFATGYKVNVGLLDFLGPAILQRLRLFDQEPQLSRHYESSVPGLHFIGPAAASSFGPVCRFVYGSNHSARHLARYLAAVRPRLSTQPIGVDLSPGLVPESLESEVMS